MTPVSLADRLVGVMSLADEARNAASKLSDTPSGDPRFLLTMSIDEHMNGLHSAFMSAYSNIDRLRQIAVRLGEKPKRGRKSKSDRAAEAAQAALRG